MCTCMCVYVYVYVCVCDLVAGGALDIGIRSRVGSILIRYSHLEGASPTCAQLQLEMSDIACDVLTTCAW